MIEENDTQCICGNDYVDYLTQIDKENDLIAIFLHGSFVLKRCPTGLFRSKILTELNCNK